MTNKLPDNTFAIFGITKNAQRVLRAVYKASTPESVSTIAREARVNRTTTGYILRSLTKQGLLVRLGTPRRPLYLQASLTDIETRVGAYVRAWYGTPVGTHTALQSEHSSIEIHSGTNALFALWQEISSLPRYTRVRGIQPDTSFRLALTHMHKHVPYEEFIRTNSNIDARKIIMETIVHEKSVDTIYSTLENLGESPVPFLKSFGKRAADVVKLPENFLDYPAEMYLYRDTALIIHWPEEYAIRIQNEAIVAFLTGLFTSMRYLCTRYNQNEKAAQKVAEVENADDR